MKLSILISSSLFFGGVLADLHNFCACGERHGSNSVQDAYWDFDTAASTYACTRYRNRNTGTKQWDHCPDCKMDTYAMDGWSGTPSCFSFGFHMGGDEFDYYCGLKGLQGYCQNAE
ncbi:hypothetical protein N7489_007564 [Penicillium chrysogenum]|uniref:Uncharacterized protein n=1 Tax=Penicillium chrysogenum TaxID=5076 RepID=A0ABQ8W847_PENCH|nr:uncharacterized protein N7489_007564 [Penicillium chrysogenum]KAJ5237473.1 hypothetical protein N7489_007564 [Penicillium chrysogenum]KAJ5256411.1 hypothetical protein N7505_011562 [Penicillium chrysogenum]KAJ5277431.1 hypothetical protein N7524_003584 [Penicillium chrysogenum]KAJ6160196.1 hypothetical protein N7497_004733 [Penicillium chrysogenum]